MSFKLIIVITHPDKTDDIVDAAKAVGAKGATIIPSRGTGIEEAKTFFGLSLEDQRETILFLVEEDIMVKVRDAITVAGRLNEHGTGIAIIVNAQEVVGITSQIMDIQG